MKTHFAFTDHENEAERTHQEESSENSNKHKREDASDPPASPSTCTKRNAIVIHMYTLYSIKW